MDERSIYLRRLVMDTMISAGRGHPGSALSLIEILRVLFDDVLNVRPQQPDWKDRDRFILSKGHGCLALYAILADKGFFPLSELPTFCSFDSILGGHPEFGKVPGVEASTGALGHGFSISIGLALAARMQNRPSRSFVVLGDGELDEGAVWEGAMTASKHRLDTLCAIVDHNGMQSYGRTSEVLDLAPLAEKWRSFGFGVREVDGHDIQALRDTFRALPFEAGKPSTVICHTTKGKGLPPAEDNARWHHKSKLKPDEVEAVKLALGDR